MGCPDDELNQCEFPKTNRKVERINGSVEASPGYFAVSLNTSIRAEMTTTNHTALYRFNFPSNRTLKRTNTAPLPYSPVILADLTDIADSRTDAKIKVDQKTGRITGNGTFGPSFGIGTYDLHFCADFKGAEIRDAGVWINNRAGNSSDYLVLAEDGNNDPPLPGGAYVRFHKPESNQIMARVGLSFFSTDQACRNAEKEIADWDFARVRDDAEEAWRSKLGVISVKDGGVDLPLKRIFWSGLYRSFISPQDYTGENPLWESDEPYFDSYYCIWDSFRSTHPLLTLMDPHAQALMVRSLLDIYKHEGKLPDCRMSLCKGFTQGGSNADNIIADSYVKGLKDGIDWDLAYEAVVSDAEGEISHFLPMYSKLTLFKNNPPSGQWAAVVVSRAGRTLATSQPTTLTLLELGFSRALSLGPLSTATTTFASPKWRATWVTRPTQRSTSEGQATGSTCLTLMADLFSTSQAVTIQTTLSTVVSKDSLCHAT